MKFSKRKKFLTISFTITGAVGIAFLLNNTHFSKQSISENEVRSQLEKMYAAEVADITMKHDVYKALIRKSGTSYLVEMNAVTGDVYSVEQTDKLEQTGVVSEETLEFREEPIFKHSDTSSSEEKVESVKIPTKITISENPVSSSVKPEEKNVPKSNVIVSPKGLKSSQSKVQEKPPEEKQVKEVLKDTNKDVLKSEASKTEVTKEEKENEELVKQEVAKIETVKEEATKTDPLKLEESKVTVVQPQTTPTEEKKTETVPKTETATIVLISEEQAIKTAHEQIKGVLENKSFVKTNEGGYYLIVMKATLSESDSKDVTKVKQTKATIQVHAISGKVLSVTWE